jgi:hypothetical protein
MDIKINYPIKINSYFLFILLTIFSSFLFSFKYLELLWSMIKVLNIIIIYTIFKFYCKSSIDIKILQTPGIRRRESHIRAVMSLLVRDTQGLSLRELADFCGRSDNTMSQAAARLEVRMRGNDVSVK